MKLTAPKPLSKQEVLALRGLRLSQAGLKRLRETGVYCQAAVSVQPRGGAGSYVIRGVESGGAVEEIGAYLSFTELDGTHLSWLERIESVARNGLHAVVLAPGLLRLQMFRYEHSYQLLITEHRLRPMEGARRPVLINTVVFHGINGALRFQPGAGGLDLPVFRIRNGAAMPIPPHLKWAVRNLVIATACLGCKHSHLLQRCEHSSPIATQLQGGEL